MPSDNLDGYCEMLSAISVAIVPERVKHGAGQSLMVSPGIGLVSEEKEKSLSNEQDCGLWSAAADSSLDAGLSEGGSDLALSSAFIFCSEVTYFRAIDHTSVKCLIYMEP